MGNMHGVTHAAKSALWIFIGVFTTITVQGQEGSGCGHTVLGPQSGTLSSQNYPGTYPSDALCQWRLRVPAGCTLRLLFGDFDVESSPNCSTGSLTVTAADGATALGPVCGRLDSADKNVSLSSNDVTVVFRSGPHRSGRGFLLSYSTDQHPDLISCLHRGSHFIPQHFSVYCPAGCRNVSGDIWGHSEQGYRDTSPVCKASVHAGATSDTMGGRVTVSRGRSLTRYESTFANGILSKMGSLSEKKLLFKQECNNKLNTSSSLGEETGATLQRSPQNTDPLGQFPPGQTGDQGDGTVLELADRYIITGVITEGSADSYMDSYSLMFSKDRKTWKVYKDSSTKDKKVFPAHADGHMKVLNSLFPPVVARFVRLQPVAWRSPARHPSHPPPPGLTLLGCPVGRLAPPARGTPPPNRVVITAPPTRATPGPRSAGDTPLLRGDISSTARTPTSSSTSSTLPTGGPVVVRDTSLSSSQPMIVAVGVVLGLVLCISCLLAGVWWRRRNQAAQMKSYSLAKAGCQSFQGKGLPSCPHSELISYPLERGVHDSLPGPPLNDYAEPDMAAVAAAAALGALGSSGGQKAGSTFRPAPLEEGYTTPFTTPFSHYDTPGPALPPEYAEPLPPEPEYAMPFSEQPATEPPAPSPCPPAAPHSHTDHHHQLYHQGGHRAVKPARTASSSVQPPYDCPSHRVLSNGYCIPSTQGHAHGHAHTARPPSAIYAEPQ